MNGIDTFQNFGDRKRCFQPNINTNANLQCDEAYIVNPDNVFSLIEARHLKKASSSRGSGYDGGYEAGYEYSESHSSSGSFSSSSSFGSGGSYSGSSGYLQHEAVQISPQRVGLKLRISKKWFFYQLRC